MEASKVLAVLCVLAVGLSGAAAGATDGGGTAPALTDFAARAPLQLGSGEWVSIAANNLKTITLNIDEPFHCQHGFNCADQATCADPNDTVQFFIVRNGRVLRPLPATSVEQYENEGRFFRDWVVDFPDGWPTKGLQTFGAVWILNKRANWEALVTIKFVDG